MNKEKKLALSGAEEMIPELRFPEFENDGEWEERNLGKVGEFVGGGTPSTSKPEYWDGNIQWYTPTEVKNGTLNPSTRTITEEGLKNSSAKLLPQGTILITTRATIGDAAITNYECTTNQGFQSLIVKKTEINLFWYYWILQHKIELERRSSGSTFKEIGKNEIKIIPTLSPKNPDEQQKIAACLSSLDDLIEAHNQKLEALKDHKKGLMQNLFPHPSAGSGGEKVPKFRFPEFVNDGEWNNDIVENLVSTITPPKKLTSSNYLESGKFPIIDQSQSFYCGWTNDSDAIIFNNLPLIIFGDHTCIIKMAKEPFVQGADGIKILKSNNIITPEFLFQFLLYNGVKQEEYKRHFSILKEKTILFPKVETGEQQKIADCLSSLDNLITAQEEKIEQLQQHKKGLMQGLFPNNRR